VEVVGKDSNSLNLASLYWSMLLSGQSYL